MYKIYDYFLEEELDTDRNYGEDLYDSQGNWLGWHVVMADAAGLTGERIAVGIDANEEEAEALCKVNFKEGTLDADIYFGDLGTEGALIGLPVGVITGSTGGQTTKKAGIAVTLAGLGGLIAAVAGFLLGKAIPKWKVRYYG